MILGLTASNDTLFGIACVVVIIVGLLFIFGRGWRR